jgi:hypothetical protein
MITQNLTLTEANTEYSLTLSENAVAFTMQARTAADVRFAFVSGKVAGSTAPYATLKAGAGFDNFPIDRRIKPGTALTIYFATSTPGTVLELIERS